MYPEPYVHQTHEPRGGRRRLRRSPPQSEAYPEGLHLRSIDRVIHVSDALDQPMVAMLMTEDFCWRTAMDDWRGRRPAWQHRAERRAWRGEGQALEEKRERIRKLAIELKLISDGG